MQQYYFLFALAFIWTIFATIQDLKTREVANWLNFSFIAFALAYRAFYSAITKEINFFLFGLIGFAIFFALAHGLYYARAFAGGDAKLLMGYGIILPYTSYISIIPIALAFLIILMAVGAIYTLLFSVTIINKNKKEFFKQIKKFRLALAISIIIAILSAIVSLTYLPIILISLLSLMPLLLIYTKAIDKCMIKLISPENLTEGDWLEKEIKLKNKTIKKSVHGLSLEEIKLLKKYKKKVLIKEGVPFVPAFLIALIITVFFSSVLQFLLNSFAYLF